MKKQMVKSIFTKENQGSWSFLIPTILTMITVFGSWFYSRLSLKETIKPGLAFERIDDASIQLSHRNKRVHMDYCKLYFPPYCDTVPVNSLELDYSMCINTNRFYYFSVLAANNEIIENIDFTIPFVIDLYYHYLNEPVHLNCISEFVLRLKDGCIVVVDWQIKEQVVKRVGKRVINYDLPINLKYYQSIEKWKYNKLDLL